MFYDIMSVAWGVLAGIAFFFIPYEVSKICSYKRVGGMRFVRFGPLCLSFCLTSKPVHNER